MDSEMKGNETKYGRAGFLRQLGVTLAVAVGAAALSSAAKASHVAGHACPGGGCNPGQCLCNCTGISENYCVDNCTECRSCPC